MVPSDPIEFALLCAFLAVGGLGVLVSRWRRRGHPGVATIEALVAQGYTPMVGSKEPLQATLAMDGGVRVTVACTWTTTSPSPVPTLWITARHGVQPAVLVDVLPRDETWRGGLQPTPATRSQVALGVAEFDANWEIVGSLHNAVLVLGPDVRAQLDALGPKVAIQDGVTQVTVDASNLPDPGVIAELAHQVGALAASAHATEGAADARLAQNLATEPDPAFRALALYMLLFHHMGTPAARRLALTALGHGDATIRALANAHVGLTGLYVVDQTLAMSADPTVRMATVSALRLFEAAIAAPRAAAALEDPATSVAAVAAEVLAVRPDRCAARALTGAMDRFRPGSEPRRAVWKALAACADDDALGWTVSMLQRDTTADDRHGAIAVLAAAGGRDALGPLRVIADSRTEPHDVCFAARRARAAIIERLGGADAGQIALADVPGGGLAIADEEAY